jgi:hypothetical protein
VEDLLSWTQVAGTGRLPYLMEGESARAVEEGQPSQTGAAPKAERLGLVRRRSLRPCVQMNSNGGCRRVWTP